MTDHYKLAKQKLHQLDIDYPYIAEHLFKNYRIKKSTAYIEECMRGKLHPSNDVCWAIFKLFGTDDSEFYKYFPMFGRVK